MKFYIRKCSPFSFCSLRKNGKCNFLIVPTVPMLDGEQRRWFYKFILTFVTFKEFGRTCRWKTQFSGIFVMYKEEKWSSLKAHDSKGWGSANSISYPMSPPPNTHIKVFPDVLAWSKPPPKDFHIRLSVPTRLLGRAGSASVPCGHQWACTIIQWYETFGGNCAVNTWPMERKCSCQLQCY